MVKGRFVPSYARSYVSCAPPLCSQHPPNIGFLNISRPRRGYGVSTRRPCTRSLNYPRDNKCPPNNFLSVGDADTFDSQSLHRPPFPASVQRVRFLTLFAPPIPPVKPCRPTETYLTQTSASTLPLNARGYTRGARCVGSVYRPACDPGATKAFLLRARIRSPSSPRNDSHSSSPVAGARTLLKQALRCEEKSMPLFSSDIDCCSRPGTLRLRCTYLEGSFSWKKSVPSTPWSQISFLASLISGTFSPPSRYSISKVAASLHGSTALKSPFLCASIPLSSSLPSRLFLVSHRGLAPSTTFPFSVKRLSFCLLFSHPDSRECQICNVSSFSSAGAFSTSGWLPWLPYGLPQEGILPQPIAESTSAASLQHAKRVFLRLLDSGSLTRSASSSAAVSSDSDSSDVTATAEACRRERDYRPGERTCRLQTRADAGEQVYSQEDSAAARGDTDASAVHTSVEGRSCASASHPAAAEACADAPLGDKHRRIFAAFAEKYAEEVALSGRLNAQAFLNILASAWQLAWKYNKYPFLPYHKALRTPLDFSAWSEMMWRPLVDLHHSKLILPTVKSSSSPLPASLSPPSSSFSSSTSFAPRTPSPGATASFSDVHSAPVNAPSLPSPHSALSSASSPPSLAAPPASSSSFTRQPPPPCPSAAWPFSAARTAFSLLRSFFSSSPSSSSCSEAAAAVCGLNPEKKADESSAACDGDVKAKNSLLSPSSSPLQIIKEKLEMGDNVIFLSNHQTEPDPQVLKLVLEHLGEREMGQRIIFVAGHKVREDPLSTPFSLGCNLFCVHSKKHLTHSSLSATEQFRRQQENVAAMAALQQALEEGAALIWVAPSGGRDRQDESGFFSKPDKFDPKAVRMFALLAKKARASTGKLTHFCPMALYTAPICPPPKQVEGQLGEPRTCAFSRVGVGIGNLLSEQELCPHETLAGKAEAETQRLYQLIKE